MAWKNPVRSGLSTERNRSEGRRPEHALGLAADGGRAAPGKACSRMAFVDDPRDVKEGAAQQGPHARTRLHYVQQEGGRTTPVTLELVSQ